MESIPCSSNFINSARPESSERKICLDLLMAAESGLAVPRRQRSTWMEVENEDPHVYMDERRRIRGKYMMSEKHGDSKGNLI